METKKMPTWELVIIAVALALTACSSMQAGDFRPNQELVKGCKAKDAEACRQLGIQYGYEGNNTRIGLALLDRSCELGSQRGCRDAEMVYSQLSARSNQQLVILPAAPNDLNQSIKQAIEVFSK